KLTPFPKDITTNAHALEQTFVLFDNFYVDADVSYNGHSYSTAAYATDFIEKMWQTTMAGRGGPDLGEGGGFMRGPFGNISAPSRGYLWDYARRANVSVRSYGEFVQQVKLPNGEVNAVESVPGLKGAVAPTFAGWDLDITDQKRVDNWLLELSQYDAAATPLFNAWSGTPNLLAYSRLQPRVALDEKNLASTFGSALSLAMDFSIEDRAPETLLNDIVWRSIRGAHSPMPPPRRSVFVRPSSA